jgi:DNA-binding transcriptional LysR family regulator
MGDIETRLFRSFVALAEERHFARAAERLGITPPTLTHQIQKLESHVGAKLFDRTGNRNVLTEAGQRLLPRAREGLRQFEEAATVARQAGRGELGQLQLGFMTWIAGSGLLQSWICPFEQAHPAIEIIRHRLGPVAQITQMVDKKLDVCFTRAPNKYPTGIRGFELYRQRLALALPSEHPLARHEAINPAELAGEAFIKTTPEPDMGFFGHTEAIARIGNFVPRVVRRDDEFITVLTYVAAGHGIAVVPELMTRMNFSDVVFREIAADPAPYTSIAFVYSLTPSPSASLLIQHMRRHALRHGGRGATPPHSHDRIIIPSALNLDPHPEVRAKRASKDEAAALEACPSKLDALRRAPHEGEEMSQQ